MDLEYAVGNVTVNAESFAIKAHRRKSQNPALRFSLDGTTWTVIGLQPGTIDIGDAKDVDHLDFYVLIDDMCDQLATMPVPAASATGRLSTTSPWGTEGSGKKRIQPGRTRARLPILAAEMRLSDDHLRATTSGDPQPSLNLDFEIAPYPNPIDRTRSKLQVHFGIDAEWIPRNDRRIRNSQATITMTKAQYAAIHQALMTICESR